MRRHRRNRVAKKNHTFFQQAQTSNQELVPARTSNYLSYASAPRSLNFSYLLFFTLMTTATAMSSSIRFNDTDYLLAGGPVDRTYGYYEAFISVFNKIEHKLLEQVCGNISIVARGFEGIDTLWRETPCGYLIELYRAANETAQPIFEDCLLNNTIPFFQSLNAKCEKDEHIGSIILLCLAIVFIPFMVYIMYHMIVSIIHQCRRQNYVNIPAPAPDAAPTSIPEAFRNINRAPQSSTTLDVEALSPEPEAGPGVGL